MRAFGSPRCSRCRAASFLWLAVAWFVLAGQARAQTTIDWPSFGGSAQRTSYNASETVLSTATVPGLKPHWQVRMASPVIVQPSLVRQVATPSGTFDLLIVTESGGAVTALDAATGNVIWSVAIPPTQLGCMGASKLMGIGEPATIDVAAGIAYVVDAGGKLHALSVANGTEQAGYPVEIIDPGNLAASTWVHYASPTLVGTNLYVGTAAFCESPQVPYHGQIIEFSTASASVVARFYPMGNGAILGGGFWGSGGLAAEPDGSFLWGGTANALPAPQGGGNAEKVLQLDPNLNLIAANGPGLPRGGDLDFGSTPLLFQPPGCPPMLAAMNKSGLLVIYDRTSLSSGPIQTLAISDGSHDGKFIGMPSFDPVTNAVYVANPLDSQSGIYLHGLVALQANASCQLSLLWQQTLGENGNKSPSVTPMVANGVVYFAEGLAGHITAFDAALGTLLWDSGTLRGATFASPFVANGILYGAAGRFIYAFGL
jgi:outer membrane protein assembly factor BamB